MDRLGLAPRRLLHPLGCAAGRSPKGDAQAKYGGTPDNRIDQSGLAGARAAGDYHQAAEKRGLEGAALLLREA